MPFDRQNCRLQLRSLQRCRLPLPLLLTAACLPACLLCALCCCCCAVVHERVLVSIYRALQGAASSPPVYGGHWEAVGFQGSDPATDVRGGGVLGLLLLLRLLQSEQTLAGRMQALSVSELQHFPLAVVCLNLAGIVLSTLRLGRLNGDCRRQPGGMWAVAHTLFAACVDAFVNCWMEEAATIASWAGVRARIERDCSCRGKQMCADFRQRRTAAPRAGGSNGHGKMEFQTFDEA